MSLVSVIRRHRWLVASIIVAAAVVGAFAGFRALEDSDELYRVEAELFVPSLNPASPAAQALAVDRFAEVASSQALADEVAAVLSSVDAVDVRTQVDVRIRPASGLVVVSYESIDPGLPADVVVMVAESSLNRAFADQFSRLDVEAAAAVEREAAALDNLIGLRSEGLSPTVESTLLLSEISSLRTAEAVAVASGDEDAAALSAAVAERTERLDALQDDVRVLDEASIEREQAVRDRIEAEADAASARRVLVERPLAAMAVSSNQKVSLVQAAARSGVTAAAVALAVGFVLLLMLELVGSFRDQTMSDSSDESFRSPFHEFTADRNMASVLDSETSTPPDVAEA